MGYACGALGPWFGSTVEPAEAGLDSTSALESGRAVRGRAAAIRAYLAAQHDAYSRGGAPICREDILGACEAAKSLAADFFLVLVDDVRTIPIRDWVGGLLAKTIRM
jgi:hypothetical protein